MEDLIFGGAYLRREICVSKSIGLALQLEGNLQFFLCFTLHLRAISEYKPPGGGGGGLYLGGLIFGILRYVFIQVLIFAEKKADVDDIHEYLLLKGVEAVAIHGDKGISSVFTRSVNIT